MRDVIVIADASPIIALAAIGELDLLQQLYERVTITDLVRKEIHAELPDWIEVSTNYDHNKFSILKIELDPGEASAIAMALEYIGSKIIIDEQKGRRVAQRLGLTVTGTVGIIIKAKEKGLIHSGKQVLDKLEKHGFWLSEELRAQILIRMNE